MTHVSLSIGSTKASEFAAAPAAVECSHVSFRYAADRPRAIEDVTLRVEVGERLGILGPNGGGKSTLIKLILGLLDADSGSIKVFGQTPRHARDQRLIGYVPQRSEAELNFPLSPRQIVELVASTSLSNLALTGAAQREQAAQALDLVGASEFADFPIGKLSGGQLQRVYIARALVLQPKILVLDEPMVGIDVTGQQQFAALLRRLTESRTLTVLVVSHDLRAIAAGCDQVACLSRTLHSHGSPQGLTPAVLAEVFRHDMASIFGDLHVDAHAASGCKNPAHTHAAPSPENPA